MRTTKPVQIEVDEIDSVTCNSCGKLIDLSELCWKDKVFPFEVVFGYGSQHDGEIWNFDLCEPCLLSFVGNLKIPVEKEDYL